MDNSNRKALLDKTGQFLIVKARDETVEGWDNILSGKMRGERAERIRSILADLNGEQRKTFSALIPEIVDSVLHNLLFALEEADEIAITIRTENGDEDVAHISDGLAGELYSEDGWIQRFSRYRK